MATIYCEVCRHSKPDEGSTLGRRGTLDENILICADCRSKTRGIKPIEFFQEGYFRVDRHEEKIMPVVTKDVRVGGFDVQKQWVQCPDGLKGTIDAQWFNPSTQEYDSWRVRFDRNHFSDEDWRTMTGEDPTDKTRFPIRLWYRSYPKKDVQPIDSSQASKSIRGEVPLGPRSVPTEDQIRKLRERSVSPSKPARVIDVSRITIGSLWISNKASDEYEVFSVGEEKVELRWTGRRLIEGEWRKHGAPGYKRETTPSGLFAQYSPKQKEDSAPEA